MDKPKMYKFVIGERVVFAVGRKKLTIVNGNAIVCDDGSMISLPTNQVINQRPDWPITLDKEPEGWTLPKPETKRFSKATKVVFQGLSLPVQVEVATDKNVTVMAHDGVETTQESGVVYVQGDSTEQGVISIQGDGNFTSLVGRNSIYTTGDLNITSISTGVNICGGINVGQDEVQPLVVYVPEGTELEFHNIEEVTVGDTKGKVLVNNTGDASVELGVVDEVWFDVGGDLKGKLAFANKVGGEKVKGDAKFTVSRAGEVDLSARGDLSFKSDDVVEMLILVAAGDLSLKLQNAKAVGAKANGDLRASIGNADESSFNLTANGDLSITVDDGAVKSVEANANGDMRATIKTNVTTSSFLCRGDLKLSLRSYTNEPVARDSSRKPIKIGKC